MKIGVLGTGMVGTTLAGKLVELGHEVTMGSRDAGNEKATAWADSAGTGAHHGTFADAAAFGEILINATNGAGSIAALEAAGAANLAGKVLVDVTNALDFSRGMPPSLNPCNTDSLGEQIQRAFAEARVVKALNTVSATVMVNPGSLGTGHAIFVCGDDAGAKAQVVDLLAGFGWPRESVIDLGDITNARGTEMFLALWIRLMGALGTPMFNIAIQRGG